MERKMIISVALAAIVAAVPACTGGAACNVENAPPKRGIEMPNLDMPVGNTMEVDLGDYYDLIPGCVEDYRDHGRDVFEAMSADPAAVAVRVTVVSIDQHHRRDFFVRVRAR